MSARCSATTKAGRPCQAWAMRHTNPPLCSIHARTTLGGPPAANQNRRTHGFYIQTYTLPELRDLLHVTEEPGIQEEIAASYIALRRILAYLWSSPNLDPDEFRLLASDPQSGPRGRLSSFRLCMSEMGIA